MFSYHCCTGCSKTTLLDILCNRKPLGSTYHEDVTGVIYVNGKPRGLSQTLSYVPQQDLLLNTATVRETFETAAQLRIANISPEELKTRVDAVLHDLGLKEREHALVGGGEVRSLSGGERRRVSIGQEIVSSQKSVLMLDEPTTGLDSTTAESVMTCLRDLARLKGMVVVATIHQPNSYITTLFDDFMLMGKGRCLYQGLYSDAVERFSAAGFACPLYCNPTDFYITVAANGENHAPLVASNQAWLDEQKFQEGSFARIAFSSSDTPRSNVSGVGDDDETAVSDCPTSTWTQVKLLVVRDWKQWFRDPGMLISELFQYIFLALFLGGMYYDTDTELESGVYNRTASLFFILSILVFTPPFTAVVTFAGERDLFTKERRDKMYSPFSWLLAKTIVLAPIEAAMCLVFSSISYFMIGYQPKAEKFFLFLAILTLFQLIGESIGMFFAVLTGSPTFAVIWMTLFLIIVLALSGFLTYEMPYFYEWIQDSNVLRFGMLGLILNEFTGLELTDESGNKVNGLDSVPDSVKPDPDLSVGDYIAILVGFLVGIRMLIYIVLLSNDFNQWVAAANNWLNKKSGSGEASAIEQEDPDRKVESSAVEITSSGITSNQL